MPTMTPKTANSSVYFQTSPPWLDVFADQKNIEVLLVNQCEKQEHEASAQNVSIFLFNNVPDKPQLNGRCITRTSVRVQPIKCVDFNNGYNFKIISKILIKQTHTHSRAVKIFSHFLNIFQFLKLGNFGNPSRGSAFQNVSLFSIRDLCAISRNKNRLKCKN